MTGEGHDRQAEHERWAGFRARHVPASPEYAEYQRQLRDLAEAGEVQLVPRPQPPPPRSRDRTGPGALRPGGTAWAVIVTAVVAAFAITGAVLSPQNAWVWLLAGFGVLAAVSIAASRR